MKITAIHFSPTGNTRRYTTEIAKGFTNDFSEIDLSVPENRQKTMTFAEDELVIFGGPVYGGRLPEIPGGIFDHLKGQRTPAIFIVTYGNRAYEDALLELKNLCESNGFQGIAAGAFIGTHTFSEKIGAGRPNAADLHAIQTLVEEVKASLADPARDAKSLTVKGNQPYKDGFKAPFAPTANESCIHCGLCARNCPVGAIPADAPETTDAKQCIACFRCVRNCPKQARGVVAPPFAGMVAQLEKALTRMEQPPELFFLA